MKYTQKNNTFSPRVEKALIEVCLNCPLPVRKCRPHVCRRYKEERKKIQAQEREKK